MRDYITAKQFKTTHQVFRVTVVENWTCNQRYENYAFDCDDSESEQEIQKIINNEQGQPLQKDSDIKEIKP